MEVGGGTRRSGAKKSVVAAGSVWETRMKSDQVKGGITVLTQSISDQSTGDDAIATNVDVSITTTNTRPKTLQTPTRRKTWRSDLSDGINKTLTHDDKFKPESPKNLDKDFLSASVGGGVKRSPIQARKLRSESRKGSDVISENGDEIIKTAKPELNRVIKDFNEGNGKIPVEQLMKVRSNKVDTVDTPIELERVKSECNIQSGENFLDVKCDDGVKKIPIVVDETRSGEICREFGVCQEKLIQNSLSNVAQNYKSSPKILETDDDDDKYEEMDSDEFEIEIEKKRFDIKEINLPEQKHRRTLVVEEKKNHQSHQKTVPISPIDKRQSTIHQNVTRANSRLTKPTSSIPKSDPIQSSYDFQRIPRTQSRLQSLADLIMWNDVSRSAFVFGIGTFIIVSSSYTKDLNISFISIVSYLGLVYLALIFICRSIISRGVIDAADESRDEYVVGEEEAIRILKLTLPYLNEFLLNLRALFSGHPATTMKLAAVLFVLARCGGSITIWKMTKLGFFGVFIVPKVCSSYSTQFTIYVKFWIQRMRDAWDSCTHKKAVTLAIFTLVWNLSSVIARIWALFMLFVAVRCYQESFVRGDWMQEETVTEDETWSSTIGALTKGGGDRTWVESEDNIVAMYRKIYRGDFKCPAWFSSEARRLIVKILDPNPSTRITVAKIMDSPWFKKPLPKSLKPKEEQEQQQQQGFNYDDDDDNPNNKNNNNWFKSKESETLNAFHIISLSEGFDLSPLFEEKKREEKQELRFATTNSASTVISKLEEVATAMKFKLKKSDSMVRLQGQEMGRKGKLSIAAEIFAVAPSLLVVEVKKDSGDTLEYNEFCSKELRPALKDIVWTSLAAAAADT